MMRRFLPKYTLVTLGLVGLTLLSFLALTARSAAGDSVVDTVSVIVPASCNLKTDAMIDSEHVATINNGTYKENIGTTTFKIFCNDNNGFSVYAIGYSDNEFGNTDMIATVNNVLSPTYNIATGLATAGNTSNWAMKLIKVDGTYEPTILSDTNGSFADYHVVPTEYTKVATLSSNTDFTVGSAFQTTYRTYISPKHPAGSYVGKVRYTLVHPANGEPLRPVACPAGKICYNPNANDVVDTMGNQDNKDVDEDAFEQDCNNANGWPDISVWPTLVCRNVSNNTIIDIPFTYRDGVELWASNFQRPGYGFAGWTDNVEYEVNKNDENGNGTGANEGYHIYGPNQTITVPNSETEGLALYAVWVKSAGSLQNWNGCSTMNIGEVTALTDVRDNNTYAVAKLKDGKCWMIENLRLGGTTAVTLDSTTTDIASGEVFTLSASQDPLQTAWCGGAMDPICTDQSMFASNNTTNPVAMMTTNKIDGINGSSDGIYSMGNYYNWYSATAGTGTYWVLSGDASGSICPIGWKLPYGGNEGSGNTPGGFYYLNYKLNNESVGYDSVASNNLRTYPNNFLYAGHIITSAITTRSYRGDYWSSTGSAVNSAEKLFLNQTTTYPDTSEFKTEGQSVRCVAGS